MPIAVMERNIRQEERIASGHIMARKIEVRVVPNARKSEVIEGTPLIVKVREPARNGKANRAVLKLLSRYFSSEVRLISGTKSRKKIFEINA